MEKIDYSQIYFINPLEIQLKEIPTNLKTLTKNLKFLSTIINEASFFLQKDSIKIFKKTNKKYRDLTYKGNAIIVEYNKTNIIPANVAEFTEKLKISLEKITKHVKNLLKKAILDVKEESLLFRKLNQLQEEPVNFELFDKRISEFQGIVEGLKKGIEKNKNYKSLLGKVKIAIGDEDYEKSLKTLVKIKKVKDEMKSFQFQKKQKLASLTKEEYQKIIFLNEILKPKIVKIATKRLLMVANFTCKKHEKRTLFLKNRLSKNFKKSIRLFRAKEIYQLWEKILFNKIFSRGFGLISEIENVKILTSQKKAFFKQSFQDQKADQILKELKIFIKNLDPEEKLTPNQIYQSILKEKDKLMTTVQLKEKNLKKNQTYFQALFARIILSLIQQPDYILGQMASKAGARTLNKTSMPILKEDLEKIKMGKTNLEEVTGHVTGLGFLGLTLWATTKIGYKYHLLMALSRSITDQIDYLIYFGKYLDKVTSQVGIRLDEQGILEKDSYINWLLGLGLNLMMNYKSPIPASIGYVAGTGSGYVVNKVVKSVGENLELDDRANIAARVIAHTVAFSLAYKYGYKLGNYYFPSIRLGMTSKEAYKILGINSNSNTKEIKKAYYKISLEKHPDRVRVKNESFYMKNEKLVNEEFEKINIAYELLTKKKK
jgi:hypothetical protein